MTQVAKVDDQTYPRRRTAEEMEAVFEHLRGWGPEGDRIVEVHKKIIALLDAMIDEKRVRRRA
jgi:hypothetical protein